MKKSMKIVLALAMVLLMGGTAVASDFNAQGSVVVPGIINMVTSGYWQSPYMVLSNITDKTISCKVTAYDHDGNDVTNSYGKVITGGSGQPTVIAYGTGEFEIPAYSTRTFYLSHSGASRYIMGYAKIEWKSTDTKLKYALIGSMFRNRIYNGRVSEADVPINNGQPF